MKRQYIISVLFLFLIGCASYKELIPNPELISKEGTFNPIQNKDENFKLKKDDLYFIKFPRPAGNEYYLILTGPSKPLIHSYIKNLFDAEAESVVTRSFGFTEGGVETIESQKTKVDSLLIYPIDSLSAYYSWMIDSVREDTDLKMSYRYVQQWRYSFENEYVRYRTLWSNNVMDRTVYNALTPDYQTDNLAFDNIKNDLLPKRKNLQTIREELRKVEHLFPPEIKQSADTAYQVYGSLCSDIDDELTVQNTYLAVLAALKKEKETRGDIAAFLAAGPEFSEFITQAAAYPRRIIDQMKKVITARFSEILPTYDAGLKKTDLNAIGPYPELENVPALFKAYDVEVGDDLEHLMTFVQKFTEERDDFRVVEGNLVNLNAMAENISDRPSDSFYRTVVSVLDQTEKVMPECEARRVEKYGKYKCALTLDQKINNATKYIDGLSEEIHGLQLFDAHLSRVSGTSGPTVTWPADSFYTDILGNLDEVKSSLPKNIPARIDPYSDGKMASWANKRVASAGKEVNEQIQRYQKAAQLVPQINAFRAQGTYRPIIRLLSANRSMGFFLAHYPDVDSLSLETQAKRIAGYLEQQAWASVESRLDDLWKDKDYLNLEAIVEKKSLTVRQYEQELFQKVNSTSRVAADTFVKAHETTLKNVPVLYKDSVFLPVYKLTFTSTNQKDLQQRRKQIEDYLAEMKNIRFPEVSIKALYKELTKNSRDQGVEKARAIVDHGKFYKGTEKQVKGLVEECDPTVAKSISKPSEYRKLFMLPTSSKKGENDYLLRLKLDIPSEAEFPVFDVNLMVPSDLVQQVGDKAWYDEITINKKPIKNEGRFHITAPTSANNYESQITPVQLDKTTSNILEIKLRYPGSKVFEVSVMAQKPILRKN
jgi:hypothetical protein